MRSIASAIMVLASCGTLSAAAFVKHGDTNGFLNCLGVVIGLFGLWGFVSSIKGDPRE